MEFLYDHAGQPYAFILNGTVYYYVVNLQGDVVRIVDESGNTVVSYVYNAWGRSLSVTTNIPNTGIATAAISDAEIVAEMNPLRYRGYYYDTETGFYYLQSRYYDPAIGRFINADSYSSTGQGILGNNMYAYCNNNPVNYVDPAGETAEFVVDTASHTIYLRGYTVVIAVTLTATSPVGFENISISFSESGQDIVIDVGGTITRIKNTFFLTDSTGSDDSSFWKAAKDHFSFSMSLFDGAQAAVSGELNDNLSISLSVSVQKSTWSEKINGLIQKYGRTLGTGAVFEGCGKNAVYGGAGGVFANSSGGIGGAGKGFNTMTFMFM